MATYFRNRRVLFCENLESRELLTVTAALNGAQLDISMDADDTAFVRFDGTNYIVANTSSGTALTITGGPATTANTTAIHASGAVNGTQSVVFEGSNPFSLSGTLTVEADVESATVNENLSFGSVNVSANTIIDVNAALSATAGNITLNGGASGNVDLDAALTASADVEVLSGGFLAVGAAINASGNTVRLVANGSISQTAIITATDLSARSVTGTIALQLDNAISGSFAAASNINVWLNNASVGQLTVGAVAAGTTGFTAVTGVTSVGYTLITVVGSLKVSSNVVATGSGDVNLKAGGFLSVVDTVTAEGSTVRLAAATGVGATAVITTANLSALTVSGTVNLLGDNLVSSTFAAKDSNGTVNFRNKLTGAGSTLVVGAVVGTGSGFAGVVGISATTGDINVVLPSESILIKNAIVVDVNHTARLFVGGNVNQTNLGKIVAGSLLVNASGNINLATDNADSTKLVANVVAKLAAKTTGAASSIRFYTDGSLDIGAIIGNSLVAGVAGVTTSNVSNSLVSGSIALRAKGDMTIHSIVRSGAVTSNVGNAISGSVRLQAGGDITTFAGANVGTGSAVVTNISGRTAQVGSIGIQAFGVVSGEDDAAFALFVGQASGALLASGNKVGQFAVKATGTTKVTNNGSGTIKLGAVAADSVVFTPGISGGSINIQ